MSQPIYANAMTGAAINLAADTDISYRALYVGVTGSVKVDTAGGSTLTFANVPVGFFPVSVKKVYSTANGTTAASILGLNW